MVFILRPLWLLRPPETDKPQTGQPGELGKRGLQGTASENDLKIAIGILIFSYVAGAASFVRAPPTNHILLFRSIYVLAFVRLFILSFVTLPCAVLALCFDCSANTR